VVWRNGGKRRALWAYNKRSSPMVHWVQIQRERVRDGHLLARVGSGGASENAGEGFGR
jgi:hypothetical protein